MRWSVPLAFALLVGGCADDEVAGASDASSGDVATDPGDTTSASTLDADTTSGADDPGVDDDTTGSEPPALELAAGIRLLRVAANQGVQVELVIDGAEVTPEDYGAHLVAGRRTLVRGFWSLHAEFTPRELVGRLTIDYPDGSTVEQDYPIFVDGDSSDAGDSFQWLLEPDDVVDGMRFRVRVLEPDPSLASGELSDPPPVAPLSGRGTIAARDVPLHMEVLLVPVLHQLDGCEQAPVPTDDDVVAMRRQLEQNNPVQSVMMSVREPMPYTAPIGTAGVGFSEVLSALAQQRELDAPGPRVYYYGLLDPCDGYPPGLLGQAIGIPPSPLQELQHQRVATGRWNGSGEAAAETFVHEIGHTQGRRHVLCSGGEAGVDSAYPHQGGRIGVWGFGIHDFQLRTPTGGRDYMTYCEGEWVSDYGWEQTLEVIETLSGWNPGGDIAPSGGVLMGAIEPDGRATWWTARGGVPPELLTPDGPRLHTRTRDGASTTIGAWVYTRPDSDTEQVVAPLPVGFDHAVDLRLEIAGRGMRAIEPATIRRLHAR